MHGITRWSLILKLLPHTEHDYIWVHGRLGKVPLCCVSFSNYHNHIWNKLSCVRLGIFLGQGQSEISEPETGQYCGSFAIETQWKPKDLFLSFIWLAEKIPLGKSRRQKRNQSAVSCDSLLSGQVLIICLIPTVYIYKNGCFLSRLW